MDQTRIINESLRCHRRAWISLIPLLGFFLAPVMVMRCVTIRRQVGSGWNPAAQHLRLGFWVSIIAFFYQLLIAVALVVVVPNLDDACNTSSGR